MNHSTRSIHVVTDPNNNIITIGKGKKMNTLTNSLQYRMWQLLTIDENQLKQLKIVEALLKEQKVIPQETIEKVLAKPFFTSGCIDKDKEPSALNVGGAGIGWKAAMIATLRKIDVAEEPLNDEQIYIIVRNIINSLGGIKYHTDDVDHICSEDEKGKHDKHMGCKARAFMQADGAAYGLTPEDQIRLEQVKYPKNGIVENIEREIINRKNVKGKDFAMVVTDYDDNDTTDSDLVFHQIPNRVVIDDELHQCFDYSRKLAHYVIHKTIAPRIVHEMKQLNLLDHITLDDAKALPIVEDMLKHTLDDHNRITIEKATEGLNKYMIHLVKKDGKITTQK